MEHVRKCGRDEDNGGVQWRFGKVAEENARLKVAGPVGYGRRDGRGSILMLVLQYSPKVYAQLADCLCCEESSHQPAIALWRLTKSMRDTSLTGW
jgi:hypothetical protein